MIGIFVNPQAGKGKALKAAALLEEILMEKEIPFAVYTSSWPVDLIQFSEAWVVGGDGTINFFINKYRVVNIPLALFKGGTGNDVAWKLYGNIGLHEQVELILNAVGKPVDAATCNEKLFINGVGIGFDGEVLRSMGLVRWLGGHLGYLFVVIKKIFSFREFTFKIIADEVQVNDKFLLVMIFNSSRTGGGFMVSPQSKINDGKLNMILCKPLSVFKRLLVLPKIEKGKHLQLPSVSHKTIEQVIIECEKELFAQLDGELIQGKKFEIKILLGYFMFKY